MRHCDSELHVSGRSKYVDDLPAPNGMLHGAIFGSPVAHGKLLGVDFEAAKDIDGVVGVVTSDTVPGSKLIGALRADEPLFAIDEVLFQGHPIAMVVATSPEIAELAVKSCSAEIEELPVNICPRVAFKRGDLLQETRVFEKGDVDAIWDECDHVVQGAIDLAGQEHLYLETNRARAIPTEDGQMQIFSSTQSPSAVQKHVAAVLKLPMHKVEVDVKRLGGGFG
ncbi:MAG: molybdopterin cofactor-binding domain-containing protein, partial [Verrucomicrobiota bacterium]|nr:molybdopterin cofactor-binding domain-containing protein [Verrucomicrobiota bacterium]